MGKEKAGGNPYRPFDLESGDWFLHEDLKEKVKETLVKVGEDRVIILEGNPGSGKTSTLMQIEKNPSLIGENYVPIYLDSRKYIKFDLDGLLFAVYKDILTKLSNKGYRVEQTDTFKKLPMEENTIESLLLKIESTLESEETFLLIFDEFDLLLEGTKIEIISNMIENFRDIEKEWSNYVLLLAGNKKRFDPFYVEIFDEFFKEAFYIPVEQTIDEKRIRELIEEPEKGALPYVYDEKAVKKISELSGRNIFFQQLICYYLFDLMKKEEKGKKCSEHHVEQAAQEILKDTESPKNKRPEFSYAWENLILQDSRLLASALADESVTIQEGNIYRLKENSLLSDIFGESLQEVLEKRRAFGYIKPMSKRGFVGYPFTIPLYGRWVQHEHPFLKTFIHNIDAIADKIELDRLIESIDAAPADKLGSFDKTAILTNLRYWKKLDDIVNKKKTIIDKQDEADFFFSFFRMLHLNAQPESESWLTYFLVDISDLSIGLLEKAYCFVQERPEIRQKEIADIENFCIGLASEAQVKIPILFYFHKTKPVNNLLNKPYLNIIGIESDDIKRISLSNTPLEVFKRILLSKLSLTKVSPYRPSGPVKQRIFYGRNVIIQRISAASNTSYAVVGARKIGKSSLLHKLKNNPSPNTIYIFMDLEVEFHNVKNYKPFMKSLEAELNRQFKKKINLGSTFVKKNLSRLPEIIHGLSQDNKTIIFIFDEIDYLLEFDSKNDFKLMHIFRKMSQENLCQFVFAGFKGLYHQKRDHKNPGYNFYEEIRLETLEVDAAEKLITEPMESIGIHYDNPADRKLILEYTARHPALLQFFCKQLVEKVEMHKSAHRVIYREDIEELFDFTYEEHIFSEVYMFFSDLSDLDRLILMVMAGDKSNISVFSLDDIENKLFRHGLKLPIDKVYNSLRNLAMRFILVDAGREQYSFALPEFPGMLKRRVGDDFKNKTIRKIRDNESESI